MVAAIDTTFPQFAADAVLLFLVGINVYLGWRFGLARRVIAFAGLYAGCLAATNVGNAVASAVHPGSVEANAWAFIAILAVVVVTTEVLGVLFNEKIQKFALFFFDRIMGTLSGLIVGLAQALVIFLVAYAVAAAPAGSALAGRDHLVPAGAIQTSMLSSQLARAEPAARQVFGPVLPDNLATHLSNGTRFAALPF
jgi:uncharacterized membrane protein required for colicin V production